MSDFVLSNVYDVRMEVHFHHTRKINLAFVNLKLKLTLKQYLRDIYMKSQNSKVEIMSKHKKLKDNFVKSK